jgi:hypothetical protein
MEISVHRPLEVHLGHEFNYSSSFIARARAFERTVRVYGGRTPTLNVFVTPRTDAGAAQYIELLSVFKSLSLHEKKGALNSTSLVSMNSSSDEHVHFLFIPIFGLQAEQRVSFFIDGESSILLNIEFTLHGINLVQYLFLVRPLVHGSLKPSLLLLLSPGLSCSSNRIEDSAFCL